MELKHQPTVEIEPETPLLFNSPAGFLIVASPDGT